MLIVLHLVRVDAYLQHGQKIIMVTTDSPMPDAMLVFQDVQQRHLINHRSTECMLPDFSELTYASVICVNAFEDVASFTRTCM